MQDLLDALSLGTNKTIKPSTFLRERIAGGTQ